jgi:hypothetical protein
MRCSSYCLRSATKHPPHLDGGRALGRVNVTAKATHCLGQLGRACIVYSNLLKSQTATIGRCLGCDREPSVSPAQIGSEEVWGLAQASEVGGIENRFGLPCDDVLEWLDGLPVYRTDERGTVEIISDGRQMWVETEHGTGQRVR